VVTVNGNGTYDTSTGTNPGGFLPTVAGVYHWVASYSGDGNNNPVASGATDEPETVVPAGSLGTDTSGTGGIGSGNKLNDSATLSGASSPTGTISFFLFLPGVTPNNPTNPTNFVYTDVVTVNGNGTYFTATQGNNPGGFLPTVTGTYEWLAIYS